MKTINLYNKVKLRGFSMLMIAVFFAFCTFSNSLQAQPLKLGQSVVTSYDEVHDDYNALKVIDLRNQPAYATGGKYWEPNVYTGPDWDHARMGNIFGIAIDDAPQPNIFTTRSTVYSQTSRLNFSGMIYKIDGTTWNVIDYVTKSNSAGPPVLNVSTIPNTGSGLGNICYDKWHKQLFVTNHEDGMIYQIKDDGTGLQGLVKDVFDPFNDDIPAAGFVARGERIWGIGVYGRSSADVRVYFGRWKSDLGYSGNGANEIWSVALDYNGNFLKSTERLEITLPFISASFSCPPSDIEFSYKGDMVVSEKSMHGENDNAHNSRNLIFTRNANNTYSNSVYSKQNTGIYWNLNNSCGGADFQYGYIDSLTNNYQECDSVLVGTGDYLFDRPGYGIVYGLQFTEKIYGGSSGYLNYSLFTDLNGIYGTQDKMTPGDVDVYRKSTCSCNYTDSLFIKDTPSDIGYEPNNQSGNIMWISDDIWVCNSTASCISHSNPIHNNPFGTYVRVRVRNGYANPLPSCGGVLTLQWAKASTALSWPKPWDGSVTYGSSNLQMGGLIGVQNIPQIPGYGDVILTFPWNPPNPDAYFSGFGGDKGHFCLIARIETSADAPYGMTFPETNDLYGNVKNNKKIAWKNVEVKNFQIPTLPYFNNFFVGNPRPISGKKKFGFHDSQGGLLFTHSAVSTKLSTNLYQKWAAGGKQGNNVLELSDSTIKILGNGAYITNITLDSNSIHEMSVKFVKNSLPDSLFLPSYDLDVIQYDVDLDKIEGGNRFAINTTPLPVPSMIKVIVEGLFNINNKELNLSDTVCAYLRNSTAPYNIVDSSVSIINSTTFQGLFYFANAPSGTYYIQLKHRNSIETWSKAGGESYILGTPLNYDFTSFASQAYGSNMVLAGNKWCIYSGDVTRDGAIDGSDAALIDNDASNFESGYVVTDLNGDGIVDGADMLIAENNASNFISVIRP